MPFFIKGLDLHAKCSTTVAITESSFEKSHTHQMRATETLKNVLKPQGSHLCKHWWTYPTCMLDLETDYAILTTHSKMAAATPPVYSCWRFGSRVPRDFLQGRGQKMADMKMQQTHKHRRSEDSLTAWSDNPNRCGATAGTRNSYRYDFEATMRGVAM